MMHTVTMDNITLINGDCMEYLATLRDRAYSLAVVDPMYGESDAISPTSRQAVYKANRGNYKEIKNEKPEKEYFDELARVATRQIVWGGNFFGLSGGVIVWQKNGTAFGEGEIAICNTHASVRFFEYTWNGMIQQDMKNKEQRVHPTQKPVALYRWLLKNYAKPGQTILDTHLGSGSSAIAAWEMGYTFTGIEIDKDYFDAAVERIKKRMAQPYLPMAINNVVKAEQKPLFNPPHPTD